MGLPALETNLIEGIVIKPLEHSQSNLTIRPIIKLKNPEFEEEEKFHKAEKWSYIPNVISNAEELHFLVEAAKKYITENRLQSAISKVGALDNENEERTKAIEKEFLEDILIDFNEDHDGIFEDIDKEQKDWIRERVRVDVNLLMQI